MLQSRDGAEKLLLHICWQAGRHTLHIYFIGMQSLRFEKELMPLLVGETRNLRLDRGAVARADALDDAVCHRSAVEVRTDDGMGCLVCIGEVAGGLRVGHRIRQEGEGRRIRVARLQGRLREVECAAVNARGRACLEPHEANPRRAQGVRECHGRTLAVRAAVIDRLAEDDAPAQIGPRREDDGARCELLPRLTADARDAPPLRRLLRPQLRHEELTHVEMCGVFEGLLHDALIEELVRLHAQGVDGGALARVEQAPLDARPICRDAHLAAERVDLANEVALAGATDGWIARHHGDVVQ